MRPALPLAIAVLGLRLAPAAAQVEPDGDRLVDVDPTVTCRAEHTARRPPPAPWAPPTCLRHARRAAAHIELRTPISFDPDKATLRPGSFAVLDDVAVLILAHPEMDVEIEGHANDDPERGARLSTRRAYVVLDYLVMRGVPAARLIARGYGVEVPLVPWTAPDARARNVRIELRLRP